MNRTEMARQSAEQKNAQRLNGEGASRMDQLLEGQLDRVEVATKELAPIVESVRIISQEARETLQGLKVAGQDAQKCLEKAEAASAATLRLSQRLTLKLWIGMVLVSLGAAAVSVSLYSVWQHFFGGDRASALLSRYQELPPAKQRQVDQLLYGTPSR